MANGTPTTEIVFIDFQTDLSSLETATDILERTGNIDKKTADTFKKTNAEIQKRTKVINDAAKATTDAAKKQMVSIEEVHTIVNKMLEDFAIGFQEGVADALREAGFEFDEFGKVVKKGGETVVNTANPLKKELRQITVRMTELKLAGEDTGEEFQRLALRAGEIQDAMGDARAEIGRFASDTKLIDGLVDAATGVAGAFSVAQGAAALFGDEGQELQETLLRVNSAMAILQGLQQLGNLLQKESAAVVALNTIAQQGYNFAIGQSIGLLKAFRIALALTGIGAVILGITLLVQWLNKSSEAIEENTKALQRLSAEMEHDVEVLDKYVSEIQNASEERTAILEQQGATQRKIREEQRNAIREELQGVLEIESSYRDRAKAAEETLRQIALGTRKYTEEEVDAAEAVLGAYNQMTERRKSLSTQLRVQTQQDIAATRKEELQAVADNLEARLAGARRNSAQELALAKQLARARAAVEINEAGQNAAQVKLIQANLQKELRALDLAYQRVRQEDRIAGLEASLAKEQQASKAINERISQDEIDIQKKLIQERARLELMQEGITANQRLNIIQQSLSAQAELQRNFNQAVTRETLEDLISRNNAELEQVNITNSQRLAATEENIIARAQIEIEAAHGLADRIKEIEAQRDADIRDARKASIDQQLQYELSITDARAGVLRRANERVLSNERSTFRERISAMNQLAAIDIANLNLRQDALEEQLRKGLISQEEYNLKFAQLKDEELAIYERTENAKVDATRRHREQMIGTSIQVAQQIVDIFQQAGQQEIENQQRVIDAQRQEVEDLLETGAITEKEAERRQKKLELEERRLRRQQAQREKDYATFKAILAIPLAFLQGMAQGGPVLGAIYAAIAGAQAVLIASKQPPKFAVGKKHLYEGPAEIGHGGELWQTEDGMHYAAKPTIVWVNKHDKVFSATETQRMMNKPSLQVANYSSVNNNSSTPGINIDYQKLGIEVGKNIPKTGFNFDASGFAMYVEGQNSFDKYLGQRRSY